MRCSEEGCVKEAESRGLCNTHYMRLRRAGLIPSGHRPKGTLEERFFAKIKKTESCWLWVGTLRPNGYGQIQEAGKNSRTLSAHRLSYELHKGAISDGMVVMHKCDNPACVNPDHLEVGTYKDNTADMINKGRKVVVAPRGENHVKARLTEQQVLEIRASSDRHVDWARRLGVDPSTIRRIREGKIWQYLL